MTYKNQAWPVLIILGIGVLGVNYPTPASQARALSPLDNVSEIALEVLVGSTLHGHKGEPLFGRDAGRDLELQIESVVRTMLEKDGIAVSREAASTLRLGVFGQRVDTIEKCQDLYVFLIDGDFRSHDPAIDHEDFVLIIGAANKANLAAEILRELTARLDDELTRRIK